MQMSDQQSGLADRFRQFRLVRKLQELSGSPLTAFSVIRMEKMMVNRNRNRIRAPRRSRQWGITRSATSIVVATQAGMSSIDLGGALEATLGYVLNNVTVSAIRLLVSLDFQATAVVGDRVTGAWGISLVSRDAFGIGGTSLPDPSDDNADWIAHGAFSVVADVAAVISRPRNGQWLIKNDSMRRMRENNSVLQMSFRANQVDDPISIAVTGRTLFLLP